MRTFGKKFTKIKKGGWLGAAALARRNFYERNFNTRPLGGSTTCVSNTNYIPLKFHENRVRHSVAWSKMQQQITLKYAGFTQILLIRTGTSLISGLRNPKGGGKQLAQRVRPDRFAYYVVPCMP